jgi:hypothetical protein
LHSRRAVGLVLSGVAIAASTIFETMIRAYKFG